MARCLLLKMADEMLEHPSPEVLRVQRAVVGTFLTLAFGGIALGRKVWPKKPPPN